MSKSFGMYSKTCFLENNWMIIMKRGVVTLKAAISFICTFLLSVTSLILCIIEIEV